MLERVGHRNMKIQRKEQGFTIVELLIVIVVIGILAGLVITTFTGIQQKARNTERQTDIKAIQALLEAYNAQSGYYPTLANMNDSAFRSANLKGLDGDALADPKVPGTQALVATPAANAYSYQVFQSDGTTACTNAAGAECAVWTLTATYEGGGTFVKKNN